MMGTRKQNTPVHLNRGGSRQMGRLPGKRFGQRASHKFLHERVKPSYPI
jgi:hypothetical protein